MDKLSIRDLTTMALLTALVTIATITITIPIPATGGYLNLGDSIIFLAAILFGWRYGMVAGGLGAALADLFVAPAFALPTLIVKGVMGLLVGKIGNSKDKNLLSFRNVIALLLGTLWMAAGYYITQVIMLRNFQVPLVEVGPNIMQGIMGSILFLPIALVLRKVKVQ
ncbi:MAG: ECF transporter S component [Clostridia bacterium]|nr:ECF transporter S component [Clostridia bacterium]